MKISCFFALIVYIFLILCLTIVNFVEILCFTPDIFNFLTIRIVKE